MRIQHTTEADVQTIMNIYEHARKFMKKNGNPNQWGPTNWPPEALIHADIANRRSYVCIHEERIVGTFFYQYGREIEPTYRRIEDGAWREDGDYGVVHRLAGDGSVRGIGSFCLDWAFRQCGHLRADTHGDNKIMQSLLERNGFVHCGTIYVDTDPYPRLAYEKSIRWTWDH